MDRLRRPLLPVVFVHGSGQNGQCWNAQLRFLAGRYRPLAVDLPGHGAPGEPRPDIDYYADAVARFIVERRADHPVLVGHSLGGAIVLTLALRDPRAYRGLVLAGTGARLRVLPALFEQLQNDAPAALDALDDIQWSPSAGDALRGAIRDTAERFGAHTLWCDLSACDRFDVMARLGELTLPALAIVGAEDKLTPVKYSRYLCQHMPHCALKTIPDAGHMAMIEQPDAFNAALAEFLAELPQ